MTKSVSWLGLLLTVLLLSAGFVAADGQRAADDDSTETSSPRSRESATSSSYTQQAVRGRFVWMYEALDRRYGVQTPAKVRERIPALETKSGELIPIIEDRRGGSFRKDERLRQMDLELEVRIHRGSPMAQIVHVYEHAQGQTFVIDYWCDICSITMFEFGPCDCCQDQNRLRRRVRE